jgi:hypothetical protein
MAAHRNKTAESGWVCWPNWETHENTGEGGLEVYLVVPMTGGPLEDPFYHCLSSVDVMMTSGDVLFDVCKPRDFDKKHGRADAYDKSFPDMISHYVGFCAILCLGSSGSSWCKKDGDYFHATYETLTYKGKMLYQMLKQLYGREPILLTFLDT